MERLNIVAAQKYVEAQVEAGWRFNNPTNQDLLNILNALFSPVEQEVFGKGICDKMEKTYTETAIEELLTAIKIHHGYHGSACVCVGCLLIKNWQSLKYGKGAGKDE